MTVNQGFQTPNAHGWKVGFRNFMLKESSEWLRTRRWWVNVLVWVLIIDGFLAFMLFGLPKMAVNQGTPVPVEEYLQTSVSSLFGIALIGITLGIVIITQDELIGEKQRGTAAWVLSKPMTRSAFFLSKFFANGMAILFIMIFLPMLLAFVLFSISSLDLNWVNFIAAVSILIVHSFFYLSLCLFLGVAGENRGMVLAGGLACLFGGQLLADLFQPVAIFTPFGFSRILTSVALHGLSPLPVEVFAPVGITFLLGLILVALSLWKIETLEF